MSMTVEQILQETQHRPEDALAELIDRMVLSRHGVAPGREEAWLEVAVRRSAELDSGASKLIPGDEVSARVRKMISR